MMLRHRLALWAATALLAACGGADSPTAPAAAAPTAAAKAFRLAVQNAPDRGGPFVPTGVVAGVDPTAAANQLMDFAESVYPEYFPGHPATQAWQGYLFRQYTATGIDLGVMEGNVYLRGGRFGAQVTSLGPLTQFITPEPAAPATLCGQVGDVYGISATAAPAVGKNAAAVVAACGGGISAPVWQQTGGPAVTLLSDKSQAISFDPPAAGSYSFQISFKSPTGLPIADTVTLNVAAASAATAQITLRASQSVRMGGKVSVRAWPKVAEGDSVDTITWTQVDGPPVSLNTDDSHAALFTAPTVQRDTLIRLRATLRTTQGLTSSDEALVLVERYVQAPDNDDYALWSGEHVSRVYAYKADGPYAGVLASCAYDVQQVRDGPAANLCPLSRLPFLAQDTGGAIPTVEQVMSRVLVSHDWLGRNFEAFLRTHDTRGDFRRMMNSVTAVVLSTQIRPSFYWQATGAIYLDGDSFWMTPEERDTMNEAPDFRSDFGRALQYADLWRYARGNERLFAFYDERLRITRSLDQVRDESGWLLYHELGHALDFMPPAGYSRLRNGQSAWSNILQRYYAFGLTSDLVNDRYPLVSSQMLDLADVNYRGLTPTAEQKGYTPDDVAGFFSADLATDPYSYSTPREDTAMTLEEFLMFTRLGIRRDLAFADPYGKEATSATIIVRWGQRGRIGEAKIKPRLTEIVQQLTPWVDTAELDRLPEPLAMRPGQSWRDNLTLPSLARVARSADSPPTLQEMWQFQQELKHMKRHRLGTGRKLPAAALPPCRVPERRCAG